MFAILLKTLTLFVENTFIMPNYAQAAIQLRQNKERRAKERGSRRQAPGDNNDTDNQNASAIKIQVI